jgi:hypothetical protein
MTAGRRTDRVSLAVRLLGVALVLCASACAKDQERAQQLARIEALEQQVRQLHDRLATMSVLLDSVTKPAHPSAAGAREFRIACPKPWQELGAIEQTAWACRSPQASSDGAWPNCNVTLGPTRAGISPKEYFTLAMSGSPQLQAAQRISERSSTLANQPSYEAIYEHHLMPFPLRVLSQTLVRGERVFAISCSASPENFAQVESTFRQIISSFQLAS